MKKVLKCLIIFILVFSGFDLFGKNISFQIDFSSRYIWRGFDLNPYRKPVVQPSMNWDLGESGFSFNLWSSLSFVGKDLHEFDVTLSYSREIAEVLSIEAGLIHYAWYFTENFTFKDDTSHEIFVSVGLPHFLFEPTLNLFYDFTVGDGFYGQLEIGHSFSVLKNVEAGLYSSLGYNGGQWLAEGTDPGFSDLNFGLSFSWKTGRFFAAAFTNYTFVLLKAISRENHFWFGVSLGYH